MKKNQQLVCIYLSLLKYKFLIKKRVQNNGFTFRIGKVGYKGIYSSSRVKRVCLLPAIFACRNLQAGFEVVAKPRGAYTEHQVL